MTAFVCTVLLLAFEMASESPWLYGGIASALFPRTFLAVSVNPSSAGLIEGKGFAASVSRPFGFEELDRMAVAAGGTFNRYSAALFMSYSGRNGYGETTLRGTFATPLVRGLIAGGSFSGHRLEIAGYGNGTAVSVDAGLTARPFRGFFLGASARGLYSSSLTETGYGGVPSVVGAAVGVCPVRGVTLAGGAVIHRYSGREYTAITSIEPYPGVAMSVSILSPPIRMCFAIQVSISNMSVEYGYSTHPDLDSGHSLAVSYGSAGFSPEPMTSPDSGTPEQTTDFPLDVNKATIEELVVVPGIGPARASTLVNYRESHGDFSSYEDLLGVPGIGPTTLENLRPYLTVK